MATCALVGASQFNADEFRAMRAAGLFDRIIAVDGGYAHLSRIDVKPDLALGDFDSLGYVPKGVRVARFSPIKDKSDMELAFERARKRKMTDVVVFGGLGGRLDHTLANMQLFARFSEAGMGVVAVDDRESVTFLTGPDCMELPAADGGTVSVFAMNDACTGVFERGLRWELDDFTLTNRTTRGLSNEFAGEAAMVGVERGTLAVFLPL